MLDALRRLVGDSMPGTPSAQSHVHPHDVRIAACALLIELANVDGQFSDIERTRIRELLQRHFGVDGPAADELMAEAAVVARQSVDDFSVTRQVVEEYTLAQRMVLAELMWQVVLADGKLDEQESYLMRKLANLLQLEPAYLSQARKKTEQDAGKGAP